MLRDPPPFCRTCPHLLLFNFQRRQISSSFFSNWQASVSRLYTVSGVVPRAATCAAISFEPRTALHSSALRFILCYGGVRSGCGCLFGFLISDTVLMRLCLPVTVCARPLYAPWVRALWRVLGYYVVCWRWARRPTAHGATIHNIAIRHPRPPRISPGSAHGTRCSARPVSPVGLPHAVGLCHQPPAHRPAAVPPSHRKPSPGGGVRQSSPAP